MNPNIGSVDRTVRMVAGLGLLSMVFLASGSARWFGLLGVVPLATASMSFCPLYTMLGISTRSGARKS
jgi:hypothetical protein